MTVVTERDQEVRTLMKEFGFDEAEARYYVALARGEIEGDVRSITPLTSEDRQRIGLDRMRSNPSRHRERPE